MTFKGEVLIYGCIYREEKKKSDEIVLCNFHFQTYPYFPYTNIYTTHTVLDFQSAHTFRVDMKLVHVYNGVLKSFNVYIGSCTRVQFLIYLSVNQPKANLPTSHNV